MSREIPSGAGASEKETRDFLEEILEAEELVVLCRNFVYPEYNSVRLNDRADPRNISVKDLFQRLKISETTLVAIYKDGQFVPGGKQTLANILKKKIHFYQASDAFTIDPDSEDTVESLTPEKLQ